MKKHVTGALRARNLTGCEDWPCEICGKWELVQNLDCHHIVPKGMGGRANADIKDNLIICCRSCHTKAHQGTPPQEELLLRVEKILETIKETIA